jgi:hypothetical protein
MSLSLALLLSAASTPCPAEQGEYRLRGDASVTARFHPVETTRDWRTGLALRVRVGSTGRSFWFLPWQGGTDGRSNLAWVRERNSPIQIQSAREDIEFFITDENYTFDSAVPHRGGAAPAHMFLPGLTRLAWMSSTSASRDSVARAFFDLVSCAPATARAMEPQIDFPGVP